MRATRESAYRALCRMLAPGGDFESCPFAPDDAHWPLVFELADTSLVLPELRQALEDKGWREFVPMPMLARLDTLYDLLLDHCRLIQEQMAEVSAALNAVDVIPVWLKGAALLSEDGWQRRARVMSDLDLWVPDAEEQARALQALHRLGYFAKPNTREEDWKDSHHYAPLMHAQRLQTLELHRHVVRKAFGGLLADAAAVARLDPANWRGLRIARLSLPDRLLHSLIQCTLMSTPRIESGRIRLMKVIDFIRLLQRTGRPELPEEMLSALSSEPWREPMGRFFTLLERDFGLPNPLGSDPFYCARVDHVVRRRGPVLTWRLRTLLTPPADWGRFLCAPREWISKVAGRIAQSGGE